MRQAHQCAGESTDLDKKKVAQVGCATMVGTEDKASTLICRELVEWLGRGSIGKGV
jgi:hypothetical protein